MADYVNSERVSLETFVEAFEQLGGPDIGREFVSHLRCQNREEL